MLNFRCASHPLGYCAKPKNIKKAHVKGFDPEVDYIAGSTCPKKWQECSSYRTWAQSLELRTK